jgi:hypothetical protein
VNGYILDQFMLGAIVLSCAVIGLFFLRLYRKSHDRLFAFFATAFWILGLNWLMLAFSTRSEPHTALYVVRLCAFVILLIGIVDKNRART